jgi:hypothetical protein
MFRRHIQNIYIYTYIHIYTHLRINLINLHSGGWNHGPLDTAATKWPIVSAPGDYDNGEVGGMIGKGNRSTRRKPAPVPLCPPQTPHAASTRTRAVAVGSQRLTAELRHGLTHLRISVFMCVFVFCILHKFHVRSAQKFPGSIYAM